MAAVCSSRKHVVEEGQLLAQMTRVQGHLL